MVSRHELRLQVSRGPKPRLLLRIALAATVQRVRRSRWPRSLSGGRGPWSWPSQYWWSRTLAFMLLALSPPAIIRRIRSLVSPNGWPTFAWFFS